MTTETKPSMLSVEISNLRADCEAWSNTYHALKSERDALRACCDVWRKASDDRQKRIEELEAQTERNLNDYLSMRLERDQLRALLKRCEHAVQTYERHSANQSAAFDS